MGGGQTRGTLWVWRVWTGGSPKLGLPHARRDLGSIATALRGACASGLEGRATLSGRLASRTTGVRCWHGRVKELDALGEGGSGFASTGLLTLDIACHHRPLRPLP